MDEEKEKRDQSISDPEIEYPGEFCPLIKKSCKKRYCSWYDSSRGCVIVTMARALGNKRSI